MATLKSSRRSSQFRPPGAGEAVVEEAELVPLMPALGPPLKRSPRRRKRRRWTSVVEWTCSVERREAAEEEGTTNRFDLRIEYSSCIRLATLLC